MQVRTLSTVLLGISALSFATRAHAEWTKDITCLSGTVYRDLREYAGREEFCEKLLPGSLRVKHGPHKFWYNADLLGDRGTYTDGRQTGHWRECSRFGRCKETDYPLIYPEEEHSGLRAAVPITFQNGKYRFDFRSCWSTWVTQSGNEDTDFNIGATMHRCFIAYFPKHVTEHGGEGAFLCYVPFAVGAREIPSLDLMLELPKLGLPQFCRPGMTNPSAVMILDKQFRDFVYDMDFECASIERDANGGKSLVFGLNRYITDLVADVAASDGPLVTRVCMGPSMPNNDQPTEALPETNGRTLFRYRLSSDPAIARRQEKCLQKAFTLKASCR